VRRRQQALQAVDSPTQPNPQSGPLWKGSSSEVNATGWLDYLQEVTWNRRWVIINLVWEDRLQA
jgi:hypothetical protein